MSKPYNERGFAVYSEFKDRYGADIRVQQSSLATEDCIWVLTEGGTDGNKGALHLTREMAIEMIRSLSEWLVDTSDEDIKASEV